MKVVVQASGGIESTVMLAKAIKEVGVKNVYAITFNDDSSIYKHKDSIAVKQIIVKYGLQERFFTANIPQSDFLEYPLDSEYPDVGFIPGLKMIMNTTSLAYAQKVGASEVWIGNMIDNEYGDEKPSNLNSLIDCYNTTYSKELQNKISFVVPFNAMTKGQVILIGRCLNVDLYNTVSCGDEKTGGMNCGVCDWCVKRKLGFRDACIKDNTVYLFKGNI